MNQKNLPTYFWILGAVVLAILCRVIFIGVYKVPTVTMTPTLIEGDILLANKLAYRFQDRRPQRGDVVVFTRPQKLGQFFIKRIVAIPNDKVALSEGTLIINDQPCSYQTVQNIENFNIFLEKCSDSERQVLKVVSGQLKSKNMPEIKLNADEYFVLGDNRDTSDDSRDWGTLKIDQVASKAQFIWISVGSTQDSISKEKGFRFSRFLTKIK